MRIGLVGAGPWARDTHAPALLAHPGVELVGGWARRPEQVTWATPFADYDALLEQVDAVALAVPPVVQAPMAVRAARAGRHLLLDKPVAGDLAGAIGVAAAVDAAGVSSVVLLTRRFAPETRAFLAAVARTDVVAAEGVWLSGAALDGPYSGSPWRHADGALADVGPHVIDLLDAALGPVTGVEHAHLDLASDTWQVSLRHGVRRSTMTLSLRTPVVPSLLRISAHGAGGQVELSARDTPALECYRVALDELLTSARTGAPHPLDVHRGVHLQRVMADVLAAL